MNKKRLVAVLSILVIVVGIVILLMFPKEKKKVTEEDYEGNPKYILEEIIVSNEKHFEYPKVKKVWEYWYYKKSCSVWGAIELSEKEYNSVIKQLDEELNIPRLEESEYKDGSVNVGEPACVDGTRWEKDDEWHMTNQSKYVYPEDAEITYVIKTQDCKYQTELLGQTCIGIFMIKKYDKYYMLFDTGML